VRALDLEARGLSCVVHRLTIITDMRLALISDVHGNDVAFRAVVEDLERLGAEDVVCLGDVVQGGAQPAEALDRLATLGCETVYGNADAFLLGEDDEEPTPALLEVRDWTLAQLADRHVEQIRSFVRTVEREIEGQRLVLFHASPRSFDDVLLPDGEDLGPWLVEADLLAGGHTHKQWTRRIGGALFVNPGAVGLAYDYNQPEEDFKFDAVAEYALLTITRTGVAAEFRRVPYSLEELRAAVLASGRPYAEKHIGMYRT
jgi:putative phosphoesterase